MNAHPSWTFDIWANLVRARVLEQSRCGTAALWNSGETLEFWNPLSNWGHSNTSMSVRFIAGSFFDPDPNSQDKYLNFEILKFETFETPESSNEFQIPKKWLKIDNPNR